MVHMLSQSQWRAIAASAWCMAAFCALGCMGIAAAQQPLAIEYPQPRPEAQPSDYWHENLEAENHREISPLLVPDGVRLLSRGKPVTASVDTLRRGNLQQITDGDKGCAPESVVEISPGLQWVQIDLEETAEIHAAAVWHNYDAKRVYFSVIVQLSNDPEFKDGVRTLYNNDIENESGLGAGTDKYYVETHKGRVIAAGGVRGRYVRLYSKGNSNSPNNHYIEVEVFGKPQGG